MPHPPPQSALFANTVISLPTGLGKTHVAAAVMYNFYRWFPTALLVFTAPTRPLVAQQRRACLHVLGIPKHDTAELTGTVQSEARAQQWAAARIVFTTPQAFEADVRSGAVPAHRLALLVVDECHRAVGRNAPVSAVAQLVVERGARFRILGLSATPGQTIESVREVVA